MLKWHGGCIYHQSFRKISNFYQYCKFLRILVNLKISTYYLSTSKFLFMGWHKKTIIKSKEELKEEIEFIVDSIIRTPSLSDKLPNYIYNRIMSIGEYLKKYGW